MLLECLKQFPHLGMVQRESIQSLTKILNLRNCDLVIESGGIQLVMRSLQEHTQDVTLLAACCRLLWRLYVDADHKQVCTLFAKTNTRDSVLTTLQNHPSDRHLHYNVVGLLKCMLKNHAHMFDQRIGHRYHDQNKHVRASGSRERHHTGSLPSLHQPSPETISPRGMLATSSSNQTLPSLPPIATGSSAGWVDSAPPKHHHHHHHHHHSKKSKSKNKPTKSQPSNLIAPYKKKQWRSAPKKSDVAPIVHILLQCMDVYSQEESVVEKCLGILSILLFDETEKESFELVNYEALRSNEKTEAARGLALDVIEQVVPGGEKELVGRFVNILKTFVEPKHCGKMFLFYFSFRISAVFYQMVY